MKNPVRFKIVMTLVCLSVFVGAFFGGIALYSHLFEKGSGLKYGNNEDLGLLILNDPRKEVSEQSVEVAEMPEEEADMPEEGESEVVVAEAEVEQEEEPELAANDGKEEEVVLENQSSAREIPPGVDNSPSELRNDALSRERFVARVPDTPTQTQDSDDAASFQAANSDTASSPEVPPQDIPVPPGAGTPDPPVDIPSPGTSENNIADVAVSVGETGPSAQVGVNLDESGLAADVSLDLVNGGEESEPLVSLRVGDAETPQPQVAEASQAQTAIVQQPRNDGRVVVGQNSLYNNALAGSVSGLIGGLGAPSGTERVQYRPQDSGITAQQLAAGNVTGTLSTTANNAVQSVNAVTSASVQQITQNVPVINTSGAGGGGAGGLGGAVNSAVPAGIINTSTGGNGVQINVNANKLNLPTTNILPNQIGVNAAGLGIRVNLGGR